MPNTNLVWPVLMTLIVATAACNTSRRGGGGPNRDGGVMMRPSADGGPGLDGELPGVDSGSPGVDGGAPPPPTDGGSPPPPPTDGGSPPPPPIDGGSPPPPPIDGGPSGLAYSDYCREFSDLRCDALDRCCADPARRFASRSACITAYSNWCSARVGGSAYTGGLITWDGAEARRFMGRLATWLSGCQTTASPAENFFAGTLGPGANCSAPATDISRAFACRPGLDCVGNWDVAGTNWTGACQAPAGAGADCTGNICIDGYFCEDAAGTLRCTSRRANFSSCTDSFQCASDFCSTGGTCATPSTADYYCLAAA